MIKSNLQYKKGDNIRHEETVGENIHTYVGKVVEIDSSMILMKVEEYGINGVRQAPPIMKKKVISLH